MNAEIYHTQDTLAGLNSAVSLNEKLNYLYHTIQQNTQGVDRIAIALYDPDTDQLLTFAHCSSGAPPLLHYQAYLAESPSLSRIRDTGMPRVVEDLSGFAASGSYHTRQLLEQGYRSSYTVPMCNQGKFIGFIFFNAQQPGVFPARTRHYLDLIARLLTLAVSQELSSARTLRAAVCTVRDIVQHRDNETGAHLERMARYARIIAQEIAPQQQRDDLFVEHIFLYAPLHDIGKVGIPDYVLLKPGKLNTEERALMCEHPRLGLQIINTMLQHFELEEGLDGVEILRNLTLYHHEKIDGSGYPEGLRGEAIPLEARIVAVADIFDALSSERPYKPAWDNGRAYGTLAALAGHELDRECVNALLRRRDEVEAIQARFRLDETPPTPLQLGLSNLTTARETR